ncbi:MAG: hypothetical protein AB7F35_18820 [Acetobacteraceae bacterium]
MRPLLPVLALVATLAGTSPALAGPAADAPRTWSDILVKTATFEVFSSAIENGLFFAFYGFGGSTTAATGIVAINAVTAGSVYAANEYVWEVLAAPGTARTDPALVAGKTVSYRALSILRSFAAGYMLGGAQATTSAAYALSVAAGDTVLYGVMEVVFAGGHAAATPDASGPGHRGDARAHAPMDRVRSGLPTGLLEEVADPARLER